MGDAARPDRHRAGEPASYAVRRGRPRDVPKVQAVEWAAQQLFATCGKEELARWPVVDSKRLAHAVKAGDLLVVDAGGSVAGFVLLRALDRTLYIEEIDVAPAHARRGLGARLLDVAEAVAARRGFEALSLITFDAVPWNGPYYRRLGFVDPPERLMEPRLARLLAESERRLGHLGKRIGLVRPVRADVR